MDFIFNYLVANKAGIRDFYKVTRDFHLKWSQPERALPWRTGRVNLMKHRDPATARSAAQLPRKIPELKWNAAPLVPIVNVMQDDVIAEFAI